MDLSSGLFALGGVALAGAVAEVRAWRESRSNRSWSLFELRRETYARAMRRLETVASKSMLWLEADDQPSAEPAFWEAATSAYETLNEIRLIAIRDEVSEAYKAMVGFYRKVVEDRLTQQPDPTAERIHLVDLFRKDLGIE